jgi:hypothetical protein
VEDFASRVILPIKINASDDDLFKVAEHSL